MLRTIHADRSKVRGGVRADMYEQGNRGKYRWRRDQLESGETITCPMICTRQCTATKDNGIRCRNRSCTDYRYCWRHLATRKHLAIRPSAHGMGLFAVDGVTRVLGVDRTRPVFERGDVIDEYQGEALSQEDLDERYPGDSPASFTISNAHGGEHMDALCAVSAASFANDPVDVTSIIGRRDFQRRYNAARPRTENAETVSYPSRVELVAKKRIYHGEEIMLRYGPSYWK